jgi:hypothetical protein
MESIKAQESFSINTSKLSDEDWKKIISDIKDEYLKQKGRFIQKLLQGLDGNPTTEAEAENNAPVSALNSAGGLKNLPEYWNAENTSQRIIDFATSFYKGEGDDGKEFYSMMKAAIEKGFGMAREIMGDMPSEIGNLTKDTFGLAMKKLDEWRRSVCGITDIATRQCLSGGV